MWNTRHFEKHIGNRLKAELASDAAAQMFSTYEVTRGKLGDNIFRVISAIAPDLSDHGSNHVGKVLDNARYRPVGRSRKVWLSQYEMEIRDARDIS